MQAIVSIWYVAARKLCVVVDSVMPGVYRHYRRVVVTQSAAQTAEITQQQSDDVKLLLRKTTTNYKVRNDRGYVRFRNLISTTLLPLLKEPPISQVFLEPSLAVLSWSVVVAIQD